MYKIEWVTKIDLDSKKRESILNLKQSLLWNYILKRIWKSSCGNWQVIIPLNGDIYQYNNNAVFYVNELKYMCKILIFLTIEKISNEEQV